MPDKNDDIVKEIGRILNERLAKEKNEDYEINPEQAACLGLVYDGMRALTLENGGYVEITQIEPKEMHGGVMTHFPLLTMRGEALKVFASVIALGSVVEISADSDENVIVDIGIPNLYRKKEK